MPATKPTRTKAATKASDKKGPNHGPKPAASKAAASRSTAPKPKAPKSTPKMKRQFPDDSVARPVKRLKPISPTAAPLNTPPSTKLHIYVVGDGESGELGLGPLPIAGKKPTSVKRPRLNPLLPASSVGVVQIAAGGMHCVALTDDQQILTWGVNDDGALGRDTTWQAPTRDVDAGEDEADSDDEGDLSRKESTPTAIPRESFGALSSLFVQVVAADSASFALTSEGLVYGWGTFRSSDGILGFTTANALEANKTNNLKKRFQRTPIQIPFLTNIVSLSAGNNHILALDTRGAVFAWGIAEQHQLARHVVARHRTAALTPSRVANLPPAKLIAAGAYHSFAVAEDGTVYAWGANGFGQTGVPSGAGESDAIIPTPTIVEALRGYTIRSIAGGEHHSLAATQQGQVLIWGRCDDNQAGLDLAALPPSSLIFDSRSRPRILAPTIIPDLSFIYTVSAGIDNSFAITSHGTAYAWGFGANYRHALGTEENVAVPTLVRGEAKPRGERDIFTFAECGGQFSVLAGPGGVAGEWPIMSYDGAVLAGPAGMEKYKLLLASRQELDQ